MDAYINQLKNGRTHFVDGEQMLEPPTKAGMWAASRIQFLENERVRAVKQYVDLANERDALIMENKNLIKELELVRNNCKACEPSGEDRCELSE